MLSGNACWLLVLCVMENHTSCCGLPLCGCAWRRRRCMGWYESCLYLAGLPQIHVLARVGGVLCGTQGWVDEEILQMSWFCVSNTPPTGVWLCAHAVRCYVYYVTATRCTHACHDHLLIRCSTRRAHLPMLWQRIYMTVLRYIAIICCEHINKGGLSLEHAGAARWASIQQLLWAWLF